jgi:hypothetical protein
MCDNLLIINIKLITTNIWVFWGIQYFLRFILILWFFFMGVKSFFMSFFNVYPYFLSGALHFPTFCF